MTAAKSSGVLGRGGAVPAPLRVAAILLLPPILLVLGLVLVVRLKEWSVDTAWERDFGPWEEFLARHPAQGANDSAIELERLAAPLGIDLVPAVVSDRPRISEKERAAQSGARDLTSAHLKRNIEDPSPRVYETPAELADYLSLHAADLKGILSRLLSGEVPRWEMDLERGWDTPLPRVELIPLQRLLLVHALERQRLGRPGEALEALEGAWRLNQSICERPEAISQRISMAVSRMQAAALRKLGRAPAEWTARLGQLDYRAAWMDAMRAEAWKSLSPARADFANLPIVRDEEPEEPGPLAQVVASWPLRPYWCLCVADWSDRFRQALLEAGSAPDLCMLDLEALVARWNEAVPGWNFYGKVKGMDSLKTFRRAGRIQLELELTRKVLEAKAARDANGGVWPAAIPGIETSANPGGHWIYDLSRDGAVTIGYSEECEIPSASGTKYPLFYTDEPPRSAGAQVR